MPQERGSIRSDDRGGFRASITAGGARTQPRGASVEAVQVRLHAVERDVELDAAETQREALRAASWSPAVEAWLATAGHSPSTHESYRKRIRFLTRLAPWWNAPIASVSAAELQCFLDGLRTRSGSPASASIKRACLAVLRGAASVAMRHSEFGVLADPTVGLMVQSGTSSKSATALLASEEATRILEVAAPHGEELRWLLALQLGLRPSEVHALEDDDVETNDGAALLHVQATLIRLPATQATPATWARQAAQADRTIPIEVNSRIGQALATHRETLTARRRAQPSPKAKQVREQQANAVAFGRAARSGTFGPAELRLPQNLLFPHPADVTRPMPDDRDTASWRSLLADAEVEYRSRSAARHYAERRLLEQLGDDNVAAAILGTAPATLLRRHPDVLASRIRSAMRRITP